MSRASSFLSWAKARSSPKDLAPFGIGAWLLKTGVSTGNEMFIFISLYLFGLIPAWWADKELPGPSQTQPPGPSGPSDPSPPNGATLGDSEA